MPTYVVLMNWTDAGAKAAADTTDRYRAAKSDLEQRGLTFKDIYWTVGPYDLMLVTEAPDDETVSGALLRLAAAGNLRTTTMRAFTEDEMRGVIEKSR